jgi:two-component system copper resistance phosphate regulon response regulator CusR
MRLLLAEDEKHAGEYLVKGLAENGFVVDWARTGTDTVHLATEADYDVVLDVGLPGLDGWEVIRRIRPESGARALDRRDRIEDRVRGLELGGTITWSNRSHFPNCWRGAACSARGKAGAGHTQAG